MIERKSWASFWGGAVGVCSKLVVMGDSEACKGNMVVVSGGSCRIAGAEGSGLRAITLQSVTR